MTCAGNRRLPAFRGLSLLVLTAIWAACAGPQEPVSSGAVCFRADDCQAGLACVPEKSDPTKRICSADLSGIVSMVDGAPVEAAAPEGAAGASDSGESADAGTGSEVSGAGGKPASGAGADGRGAGGASQPGTGGGTASAGAGGVGPSGGGGASSGGAFSAAAGASGTGGVAVSSGGAGGTP
jgi:hypothetical protein